MRGAAEWKPKLRWLIRRMRLLRPSRRPVGGPGGGAVGEAEADGGEDAVRVAADRAREPNERDEPGAGRPGEPGVEVGRREPWVVELVEQPQLLFDEEGAVERLVGD